MSAPPRFGPLVTAAGVTFRLWAPAAQAVKLLLDKPREMAKRGGWFELHAPDAGPGTLYRLMRELRIDGLLERDPRGAPSSTATTASG